jgi:hypothetical protein
MNEDLGKKQNVGIEKLKLEQIRYCKYASCDVWRFAHDSTSNDLHNVPNLGSLVPSWDFVKLVTLLGRMKMFRDLSENNENKKLLEKDGFASVDIYWVIFCDTVDVLMFTLHVPLRFFYGICKENYISTREVFPSS